MGVMEAGIPATYLPRLFKARQWSQKLRDDYDKMIRAQPSKNPTERRREDPKEVAFPHRLKFAHAPDDGLELDAEHLRLVCDGERISDWAGSSSRLLGGHSERSVFKSLLSELGSCWGSISGAVQLGQHIRGLAARHLTDLLLRRERSEKRSWPISLASSASCGRISPPLRAT